MTSPDNISSTTSTRRFGAMIAGAAMISAVGVGTLAMTATSAAFTGQTDNTNNAFDSATVALTDDDGGNAMFAASNMIPSDTVTDCIEVTYTGSTTDLEALKVFGTSSGELRDLLDLSISHGGADSSCDALGATTPVFDGSFTTFGTDYAGGAIGFTPSATGETVAYQFDITLDAAADNGDQGKAATADFTWEVRSN